MARRYSTGTKLLALAAVGGALYLLTKSASANQQGFGSSQFGTGAGGNGGVIGNNGGRSFGNGNSGAWANGNGVMNANYTSD